MELVKIELIKLLILVGTFSGLISWDVFERRKDERRFEKLLTEIREDMKSLHRH
jgi:hypothetical protein